MKLKTKCNKKSTNKPSKLLELIVLISISSSILIKKDSYKMLNKFLQKSKELITSTYSSLKLPIKYPHKLSTVLIKIKSNKLTNIMRHTSKAKKLKNFVKSSQSNLELSINKNSSSQFSPVILEGDF